MTKNDYDQTSPCGERNSLSEIARKLGRGFAARARDHDKTDNFVAENFGELKTQRFMNPAARRWLFIMPQTGRGGVGGYRLPASGWAFGYGRSFSPRGFGFASSNF